MVTVQVPFGFSPMNAPSGSSGVSVASTVLDVYAVSVTRKLGANGVAYGTGLPGSASSSQSVPLYTLAMPAPADVFAVVMLTVVPAGDVRVTFRSLDHVWVRNVVRSRSCR